MCDLWSAGVILFIMLAGFPPFYGENDIEVFEKVLNLQYDFEDEAWDNISQECKDLISKLLVPAEERISCRDALIHPWILKNTDEKTE